MLFTRNCDGRTKSFAMSWNPSSRELNPLAKSFVLWERHLRSEKVATPSLKEKHAKEWLHSKVILEKSWVEPFALKLRDLSENKKETLNTRIRFLRFYNRCWYCCRCSSDARFKPSTVCCSMLEHLRVSVERIHFTRSDLENFYKRQ